MDLDKIIEYRQKQEEDAKSAKQEANHNELADSLNNILLATMVSKDPKMIEVAKNLADLLQSIAQASSNFQNSSLNLLPMANAELAQSVRELAEKVESHSSQTDLEAHFQRLSSLMMRLADKKSVVNVPSQPVSVDLKPLQKTLDKHFLAQSEGLDLSSFKAQDLDDMEEGVQFVGFVNPAGQWYILKNVESENTLRYKFGKTKYSQAWQKASAYKYSLLNEAIREIQA